MFGWQWFSSPSSFHSSLPHSLPPEARDVWVDGFINMKDMYNNDDGKGGAQWVYEAHEVN